MSPAIKRADVLAAIRRHPDLLALLSSQSMFRDLVGLEVCGDHGVNVITADAVWRMRKIRGRYAAEEHDALTVSVAEIFAEISTRIRKLIEPVSIAATAAWREAGHPEDGLVHYRAHMAEEILFTTSRDDMDGWIYTREDFERFLANASLVLTSH